MLQIVVTVAIFIVTLTKGAPAFPIIIIAFVPVRLLLINRVWDKGTLRFVDAWACREGAPEDDEDTADALSTVVGPAQAALGQHGTEKDELPTAEVPTKQNLLG